MHGNRTIDPGWGNYLLVGLGLSGTAAGPCQYDICGSEPRIDRWVCGCFEKGASDKSGGIYSDNTDSVCNRQVDHNQVKGAKVNRFLFRPPGGLYPAPASLSRLK